MNDFNRRVIEEFRANEGKVGGMFQGAPVLLLTSTGARSGQARTTPVVFTRDGARYVIIASKGGAPTNPAWYHNLRANPDATIEVGTETIPVRASITEGPERDRLFEAMSGVMPGFADYQRNTRRVIPVIALEPKG
ncbi:MAG TPA: nitroreductase family deazaflavin-dependent oxidoreductase [Dehalococcoidia bacterium]|nr:nitroreductase family deazaflavin-dependent oxidoreductase [Dehalococcoidia bacterium]